MRKLFAAAIAVGIIAVLCLALKAQSKSKQVIQFCPGGSYADVSENGVVTCKPMQEIDPDANIALVKPPRRMSPAEEIRGMRWRLLRTSVYENTQAPAPIPFTLAWQADTTTNTTFALHSLLTFNGQPAPVLCNTTQNYDVWCGEVIHYNAVPALDPVDFNFPDGFLLEDCSQLSTQSGVTLTSSTRRTVTTTTTYSCATATVAYTVQTVTNTKQYLSWCRFRGCWNTFNAGMQSPITGTVMQD